MFIIQLNGAPVTGKVVITGNSSETRTFILVGLQGAGDAGKLVTIETTCLLFISAVLGNLDANGQFSFVVGPSFYAKGNTSMVISVGNAKKSLEVQFV